MAEQVVANAHFLSPTASPPQVNPSWLCYPVLMSVRSPLLPCSALFLTASQTHAVTQPRSACLFTASLLGPSTFSFHPSAALSQLTSQQPMVEQHAARQTPRQDTPPQHTSLNMQHGHLLSAMSAHLAVRWLELTKLVSP